MFLDLIKNTETMRRLVHEMRIALVRIGEGLVLQATDEVQLQKFEGMETHVSYLLIGPSESE